MFVTSDAVDAYSIAALAGAPSALYLSKSLLAWPVIFLLFSLPATTLLINLGYVSGAGPVLTFQRIAPIASGVGWALTWLVGERLFTRSLVAAQNIVYMVYSLRTRLDWALDCDHSYNNVLCVDFLTANVSHGKAQHHPDNNWPAQQFNRYGIRDVPPNFNTTVWVPNEWYFGSQLSDAHFSLQFPPLILTASNIILWITLFAIIHRYRVNPGWFLARFCIVFPYVIYAILAMVLSVFGHSFGGSAVETEFDKSDTEQFPYVYFSEVHGFYRTTIALMDYSSAFTGIIIYASSRIRSGSLPMNSIVLLTLQVFAPTFSYVLRSGCDAHLSKIQPAYESYLATDATFLFDTAAVCFATMRGGPIWSFLFYTANLFFSCIGPMVIYILLIYTAFLEQFPIVEHFTTQFIGLISFVFAITSLLLCMPMGTSFGTLLQYVSQASITQILMFIIIFFVYGWYNLDSDVRLMQSTSQSMTSLIGYLLGPTSPIFMILLFTSVPALLASKFVSVFDLLMGGMDIMKHVDYATEFLTNSLLINRMIGYGILSAPLVLFVSFAVVAFYRNVFSFKMPWGAVLDPTSDWNSRNTLRQTPTSRPPPLSHRIFTNLTKVSYRKVLFVIFVIEILIGIALLVLFISNAVASRIYSDLSDTEPANNYRSVLLSIFITAHVMSLFEIKWALKRWDHTARLSLYIGVATMEMAFLNGYMWMFAMDFKWGTNFVPIFVIFINTLFRGIIISLVVAIKWSIAEMSHPTRTRDATEIYDASADLDADVDREDDAPIIYEMRRDVFA